MSTPKQWHTKSGALKSECPKCHDLGYVLEDCDLCGGTNELGMGDAIKYILAHPLADTDPAPPYDPEGETKK